MDKKKIPQIVITVAAVLAVAVVIAVVVSWRPDETPFAPEEPKGTASEDVEEELSRTRVAAPADIVVPEKGEAVPANVAPPEYVVPANPAGIGSFRSFDVRIDSMKFVPETVIVKQGDTAHIRFAAVDQAYDVTQPDYGFKAQVPKGQSKLVEFSATASGQFMLFCTSCGGPDKGPIGYLIVAKK